MQPQETGNFESDAVSKLSFGALAAEREKDVLPELFISTPHFARLGSPSSKKVLILGNRGAGKTAALTMLAQRADQEGVAVVWMQPEDYAYELLHETLATERAGAWAKVGAYTAAWKNLIYISAMRAAIGTRSGLRTGPARRLYD